MYTKRRHSILPVFRNTCPVCVRRPSVSLTPTMLRALITTSAEEEWWAAFWRRFILVVSTWMTGHIYVLLSEIGQAVDMHTQTAEDGGGGGGGGAAAADGSSSSASAPRRKAGFSCPRVGPEAVDQAAHSWSSLGADNFRVRCGPNYKRNGFKEPSGPALGEVVAVDTLRTEKKVFDFLSQGHIELPQGSPDWSEVHATYLAAGPPRLAIAANACRACACRPTCMRRVLPFESAPAPGECATAACRDGAGAHVASCRQARCGVRLTRTRDPPPPLSHTHSARHIPRRPVGCERWPPPASVCTLERLPPTNRPEHARARAIPSRSGLPRVCGRQSDDACGI